MKVNFEGKTYTLVNDAYETDRHLNYPKNLQDVEEGEEYDFEMECEAVDDDGNEYKVRWIFSAIKGDDLDLSDYDYSTPDYVVLA